MDRACCVSRSRLCAAATPTQLITPLFISNNGRGWNKSEPRTLPASSTRKVQTGTLKRASGFKRYSLSFLMEKNRKWRREARLLIYTSPQSGGGGEKSRSASLSTPLVCFHQSHTPVVFSAPLQHRQNTLALCPSHSGEMGKQWENLLHLTIRLLGKEIALLFFFLITSY